jgi:hypothetical protein
VLWEEELPPPAVARDQLAVRRWTGLTDNYLRVECGSPRDLLGSETMIRLANLEGELFHGALISD